MSAIQCSDSFFSHPTFSGIEVISISTKAVQGHNSPFDVPIANHGSFDIQDESFCNVTVQYTHPGNGDNIHVELWLPWADQWNERIMAVGGGGWAPGRDMEPYHHMSGAVSLGYATLSTDAGIGNSWVPANWALESPGVTNYVNVENWGSVSLEDLVSPGFSTPV